MIFVLYLGHVIFHSGSYVAVLLLSPESVFGRGLNFYAHFLTNPFIFRRGTIECFVTMSELRR